MTDRLDLSLIRVGDGGDLVVELLLVVRIFIFYFNLQIWGKGGVLSLRDYGVVGKSEDFFLYLVCLLSREVVPLSFSM